jgi:hypothetical protein
MVATLIRGQYSIQYIVYIFRCMGTGGRMGKGGRRLQEWKKHADKQDRQADRQTGQQRARRHAQPDEAVSRSQESGRAGTGQAGRQAGRQASRQTSSLKRKM